MPRLFVVITLLLYSVPALCFEPPAAEVERIRTGLERILRENMVPFWYPQTIDRENGGYNLHHDGQGQWLGASTKALVTQARSVWFFSRLYNSGYGNQLHLEAARWSVYAWK